MAPELVGLLSVGAIVALIYAGMTIAVALGVVSFAGVWILRGDAERALGLLGLSATEALASPIFAVVPLFVLMGMLVSAAGMGRDAFDVAQGAFGRVRGGARPRHRLGQRGVRGDHRDLHRLGRRVHPCRGARDAAPRLRARASR